MCIAPEIVYEITGNSFTVKVERTAYHSYSMHLAVLLISYERKCMGKCTN